MTTRTNTQADYSKKIYHLIVAVLAIGLLTGTIMVAWAHQRAQGAQASECVQARVSGAYVPSYCR